MAPPRVFVSSTYYDLKHLRSSLENFIESLGYIPILSEKGHIAYAPDRALDESCYREVRNADVFVIIIGGRYGTEKSDTKIVTPAKSFFDAYDSITRQEYRTALDADVPVYILIEKSVYADYETYLRNKANTSIVYAHVDSANVFALIDDVLAQPRNNPMHLFDRYAEIEAWLREQWAGLFRELLSRMTGQQQLATLAAQVTELAAVNQTLKAYLEQVMAKVAPAESDKVISDEAEKLTQARVEAQLAMNDLGRYLMKTLQLPPAEISALFRDSSSAADLMDKAIRHVRDPKRRERLERIKMDRFARFASDVNDVRQILGLQPFELPEEPPSLTEAIGGIAG